MVKEHIVRLTVKNKSGFTMNFKRSWYDSGRLANSYSWPKTVEDGDQMDIMSYERDWALAGCSGYVDYEINGTVITFGFSNPSSGKNKLGIGTNGKAVWDNMEHHGYDPFVETLPISGVTLQFKCKCTGSTTNHATVDIEYC